MSGQPLVGRPDGKGVSRPCVPDPTPCPSLHRAFRPQRLRSPATTNVLMICKKRPPRGSRAHFVGPRVPFWTEFSGSKPPSLAIPTAITPEKRSALLWKRNARKAAIHYASSSAGSGWRDRGPGAASPVPPGAFRRCRRPPSSPPGCAGGAVPINILIRKCPSALASECPNPLMS
jgi:hypothetical protein